MPGKQRSAGVTAAATLLFIGSAVLILVGLLSFLGLSLGRLKPNPEGVPPGGPDLVSGIVFAVGLYSVLAAVGVTTGIGLLRLKAWGRVLVLILSAFFLLGSLFAVVGILVIGPAMPHQAGGPAFATVRNVVLAMTAVPALLSIWWLIYFNRKSVRDQFDEYPVTGEHSHPDEARTLFLKPHPPLSIVLIGSMYLFAAFATLPTLAHDYPVVVFGTLVFGPVAKAFYVLSLPLALYVGIGLLRLKPPARVLAIALSALHMLNSLLFVLRPGLEERMMTILGSARLKLGPSMNLEAFVRMIVPLLWLGLAVGLVMSSVILWVLVTRKGAFTRPAAAPTA